MEGNSKKRVSKIPVLRELCTNIQKGDQEATMGKRFRFLNFLSRVGGERSTAGRPGAETDLRRQLGELRGEMEKLQEEREGQGVTRLCQKLESCQNENKYLKTKLRKYEKLCFGLDQVFEHYQGPPQAEGTDVGREKEGEELLDLFVENVILRSKQTLQEEQLQIHTSVPASAQTAETSLPISPPCSPTIPYCTLEQCPAVETQTTPNPVRTQSETQTTPNPVRTQSGTQTTPNPVRTQSETQTTARTQSETQTTPNPVRTQSETQTTPNPVRTQSGTQTTPNPVRTQSGTQTTPNPVRTQSGTQTTPNPVRTQSGTQTTPNPVRTQSETQTTPNPVHTQTTQTGIPVLNVSVNTSLMELNLDTGRTQPVDTATNTSLVGGAWEGAETPVDAAANTSWVAEPPVDGGGRKQLEAALATQDLLQSSLEDSQRRVSFLETASASLREELEMKDTRLAAMGSRLLDLISKFEAAEDQKPQVSQYRELYHQSVQHGQVLQSQVERFRILFTKLQRINILKEVVLSSLAENKELVEKHHMEWLTDKLEWKEKLDASNLEKAQLQEERDALRRANEVQQASHSTLLASHARLLASNAITRAVQTVGQEQNRRLEESVGVKEADNAKLKKQLSKLANALQRSRREQQEAVEFFEAERETLLEANAELESQIPILQSKFEEKVTALRTMGEQLKAAEEGVAELKEDRSSARELIIMASQEVGQLRGAVKEVCSFLDSVILGTRKLLPRGKGGERNRSHDPTHLDDLESLELIANLRRCMKEVEANMASLKEPKMLTQLEEGRGCECCQRLRGDLASALRVLNEKGMGRYGDLLREKFTLQEKVRVLTAELNEGACEYKKLTSYIQQYQANVTQKINTLKENLSKAEVEVCELDKLVDQVREVLHCNISHVKECRPLLVLLTELDGNEAPNHY